MFEGKGRTHVSVGAEKGYFFSSGCQHHCDSTTAGSRFGTHHPLSGLQNFVIGIGMGWGKAGRKTSINFIVMSLKERSSKIAIC